MQNHFPFWKNLLILTVLVLGIVYALPNLFGDDPSVQISTSDQAELSETQVASIEKVYKQPLLILKQYSWMAANF